MPLSLYSKQVLITATRFLTDDSGNGQLERESLIENCHLGWLVVTNRQQQLLYSTPGSSEVATFFRSSAKPFQAFPLVDKGFADELTTEELAITCASHVGSPLHTELACSILKKAGLPEEMLQCGPHAPIDKKTMEALRQAQQPASRIHNNCSGKHAGMLLYCRRAGLDPSTYLEPGHPLQQHILAGLRQWGQVDSIPLAIDGCGAPVFYLPLGSMALLYAHLGSTPEFEPLKNAMTSCPAVVGGEGRVDTVIMQASQSKLLAKVGADGVLCVAQTETGEGLALKIADGDGTVRDMALVQILIKLGWLDSHAAQDKRLTPFINRILRSNTQHKTVGEYHIHFDP